MRFEEEEIIIHLGRSVINQLWSGFFSRFKSVLKDGD